MADISKCHGIDQCPLCVDCVRRLAPITPEWQSYIAPPATQRGAQWHCEMYWHIGGAFDSLGTRRSSVTRMMQQPGQEAENGA
jgi:hypothetical protein